MSPTLGTTRSCSVFTFPLSLVILWRSVLCYFHLPFSCLCLDAPHTEAVLYLPHMAIFSISRAAVLVDKNKPQVPTELT